MHSEHKEICLGAEPIQLEIRPYSLFVGSYSILIRNKGKVSAENGYL